MSQDLFRAQALEARRNSWLGGILLAQPLRPWLLTTCSVLAAALVLGFLLMGTYTRRSHVVGMLVPVAGLSTVLAPATGVLSRLEVPEGTRVNAGQRLAVINVPRATVGGGDTQAALASRLQRRINGLAKDRDARHQRLDAQSAGLSGQLAAARRETVQVDAEIDTRRQQVRLANETLSRLRGLHVRRYVTDLQLRQQETAALEQLGQLQILQRQSQSSRRLLAQLEQAVAELPGQRDAGDAGFERDLALLEQEQVETLARGELAITAPIAGVVATPLLKPGQAVQVGQPLLSVLPGDGQLEAELLVPSRAIGFIEAGDIVLLRYQAFPYQKFGHHRGRVARISRSTVQTSATPTGNAAGEPHYRVSVALGQQAITAYGQAEPLRPGMLLDADVLGEKRRLIEWVLEPIYSLHGTLAGR
jgi:membrane fusion protein